MIGPDENFDELFEPFTEREPRVASESSTARAPSRPSESLDERAPSHPSEPSYQRAPYQMSALPPPMPPEIAKALSGVMGGVKRLHRSETNRFASYNYASADNFFEAISPLMVAEGLLIIPQQVAWETRVMDVVSEGRGSSEGRPQRKVNLILHWDFYLAHSSGAMWMWPLRRTIITDSGGPQKWGGAQTYVVKQFLRALLLIPTGEDPPDKDADKTTDADAEQPFRQVPPPQMQTRNLHPTQFTGGSATSSTGATTRTTSAQVYRGQAENLNPTPANNPSPEQEVPAQGLSPPQPARGTGTAATDSRPASPETIDSFLNALALQKTREDAEMLFNKFRTSYGPRLNEKQHNLVLNTFNRIMDKLERYKGPDASRSP